ncbi:MAG: DUF4959 domain-containing protein [Spirochaetes bacterium]|nr:DUF4959 domain-containing protein [Spirochaetota bacterium]
MFKKIILFSIISSTLLFGGCDSSGGGSGDGGSSGSEDTTPPEAVVITGITAGQNQINIDWTNPADSDLDHVQISWTNVSSEDIPANVQTHSITGLDSSTKYTLNLTAVDTSENSSEPVTLSISTTDGITTPAIVLIYTKEDLISIWDVKIAPPGSPSIPPTAQDLENLTKSYILMSDIDLAGYNPGDNRGWIPIGTFTNKFTGKFDGNGHIIKNMYCNRRDSSFFNYTLNAEITNVHLINVECTTDYQYSNVVGLTGYAYNTKILNSHVSGNLKTPLTDYTSHACGMVSQLLGDSIMENCYSVVTIESGNDGAGLIRYAGGTAIIKNCYAKGSVNTGGDPQYYNAAGIVSTIEPGINCINSYSTVQITGTAHNKGGICAFLYNGAATSQMSNCFWDTEIFNTNVQNGGTGKTTAEMTQQSTYTNWDFTSVWAIDSNINNGYPYLRNNPPVN